MKNILALIFLVIAINSYGQTDTWKTWDERYKLVDYKELIDSEKHYADSVENNPEITQYFTRIGKYKIIGKYLGEIRPIQNDVLLSMKRVFKLFLGDPKELDNKAVSEFLFEIDGIKVWFPIQKVLELDFKEEIKKGNDVVLYCLFFNEHGQGKVLYNTFYISEFYLYQP